MVGDGQDGGQEDGDPAGYEDDGGGWGGDGERDSRGVACGGGEGGGVCE